MMVLQTKPLLNWFHGKNGMRKISIHEIAMNTEEMLPGVVYSYITGREIFISYLKDTLKRDTSHIPYGRPDICQSILKEYICIP